MTDRPHDEPGPLARLRTELAGPRGYQRVDALLSHDDAAAAVAALSPPELFELVHEVGFNDTQELIALATPEQIRGCLDLDVWDRDQLLDAAVRPWLATLLEVGPEKVAEAWGGLDYELRARFLQRNARIYDLSQGEEPDDDDGAELYTTSDTYFALALTGDDESRRLVRNLMEALYATDPGLARHMIMTARAEPPAELEEMAYRWRAGRMADLGYVDFYEALDLFQPLDAADVAIGEGTEDHAIGDERLPVAIAEEVLGRSFLARALDRLDQADAERVQGAILVLTNKVLAAARIKPGDLAALRRGAHYATATLSLGLEVLARGDVARGEAALRSVAVTRLFRIGYTVPLKLARLARTLAPRASSAGDPAGEVLHALVGLRPWMSRALDTPPVPHEVRPFEAQADVRQIAELLARLTLRIAIAESLGVDLVAGADAPGARPALDDHARTAMVRAMLGMPASAAPLDDADLARFRERCFADRVLDDDASERAAAALARRLDERHVTAARDQLAALTAGWLADLERTFAPLVPPIDGRFVEGVIVASARD